MDAIRRLFGSDLQWPLYDPTKGFETYYADWYIGKGRARALADYALDKFDTLIAQHTLTPEQEAKAKTARNLIEQKVLSWQDEDLGPKTPEGIPLSKTGPGAKQRYLDYIDTWIAQMVNSLVTGELPEQPSKVPEQVKTTTPTTPKSETTSPVPNPETTSSAPKPETASKENMPAPAHRSSEEAKFDAEAEKITKEPWLVPQLKETLIEQARKLLPFLGLEDTLDFLRQQVESIGYFGRKHGDIGGALIRATRKVFGADPIYTWVDWYIGPKRAEGLYQYAEQVLASYLQPLMKEVYGKPEAEQVKQMIQDKLKDIHDEILTWQDEEKGPKNPTGVPLSKTGRGAKARYEQYISTWMKNIADNIIAQYQGREKKQEVPGPDWAKNWGWFDATIQQAINDVQRVLGGEAEKIDWNTVWDAVPSYDSPAGLAEHFTFDEIGARKILYNDVLRAIRDLYRDKLPPEVLAKLIGLLPHNTSRATFGPPATLSPGVGY